MKRQTRIITLLVIDSVFFFVEIIVGYMVHSLALVADSFHMLNDVMSLIVALYAIKLAARQTSSPKYSYGWQRAEILGALINGVFLLALCLSIFLEAIQRFFEPQTISQPVLILIVGSAGLASNIVGLVLFHDHGHGGHAHSHGGETDVDGHDLPHDIEAGESHSHAEGSSNASSIRPNDDHGAINDILPETIVRRASSPRVKLSSPSKRRSSQSQRTSRQSFASADDIFVSPAANRRSILSQAQEIQSGYQEHEESGPEDGYNGDTVITSSHGPQQPTHERTTSIPHHEHNHSKPKANGEGGHSHQNLNMRGVFLHVLGDALGNIGVIATALFIWLTDFSWRFYSDPVISLVITGIIFSSALPLVKSASLILLQGVPRGISLDDVKEDILHIDGVTNVHELHIWQLSDVKMIASVHIQVNLPKLNRIKKYHSIARAIRTCLHAYGIHSSTIQPEFADKPTSAGGGDEVDALDAEEDTPLLEGDSQKGCLFECVGGGECADNRCCDDADVGPKGKKNGTTGYGSGS